MTNTTTEDNSEQPSDELQALKARADLMGIKYHHNIGLDKLKAKVNGKLEGNSDEEEDTPTSTPKVKNRGYLTHKEYMQFRFNNRKKYANRLIRIRISCMNPNKKSWQGEIFSVGSPRMGTYKKYIPYETEWHVPYAVYEYIKERKYSSFYNVKGPRGETIRKSKLTNEFAIEVLPPLTKAELKELARRQALANGAD